MAIVAVLTWTATLFVGVPATTAAPTEQLSANRFSLTIDAYEIASFNHLEGLTAEVVPTEFFAASERETVVKNLAGKAMPPTITLQRSLTGSMELWAWHEAVRLGQMATARKSASLTMYDNTGKPVAKYWLEKAWPSKLEVNGVKSGSSEAMLETVTLVCEYIQRVSP